MGARIFKNLSRVQNYLDILKSEIEHPQKSGPGSSPEDWLEATEALRESLTNLEYLLKSGDLEATNEE
ncbi:MAG: hypothetical protein K9N35_00655 [Candidatus Marinimicrobia bacterium]|nr:hypothetical protein [Candidatus Neomarinimicrobiota bacterium]